MAETACEVWFYHLERTALDQALPELLERTLARGWRAQVRSPSQDRLDHLDGWLWSFKDDSFLPHGLADEPDPDLQPVLLTRGEDNPNGAKALFLIDDAAPGPLANYERCLVLFDGNQPEAVQAARRRWGELKAQGCALSYWQQGERGWEKKA